MADFDRRFFGSKLGGVELKWSKRMTLCAGLCRHSPTGGVSMYVQRSELNDRMLNSTIAVSARSLLCVPVQLHERAVVEVPSAQ
jgi:hypothetical protein